MKKLTDKDIILKLMESLGLKSVNYFATEIGYKNSSGVFNIINGMQGRKISDQFIKKVMERYPQVNEMFLRGKSDEVLLKSANTIAKSKSYTLNDLPLLFLDLIAEQKKTNEILKGILEK